MEIRASKESEFEEIINLICLFLWKNVDLDMPVKFIMIRVFNHISHVFASSMGRLSATFVYQIELSLSLIHI